MSTTIDHIIRHGFHDLEDKAAAMEFMTKSISQLRSRLRIKDDIEAYCHDYEDFGPEDPGWTEYWFNIPNYDATVQLGRGFWMISQALSPFQLFTRFNGRYTIRHAIFDIARALDQNEAWHCTEYYGSFSEDFNYSSDNFDRWLEITRKEVGQIKEFEENQIDEFYRNHPNSYYSEVIHDSFKECREQLEDLKKHFPGYEIVNLAVVGSRYVKLHNRKGCFLADINTKDLLLPYPIDDVLENVCGAGMVLQKNGKSAFISSDGQYFSNFVKGKWEWEWLQGIRGVKVFNKESGDCYRLKYEKAWDMTYTSQQDIV